MILVFLVFLLIVIKIDFSLQPTSYINFSEKLPNNYLEQNKTNLLRVVVSSTLDPKETIHIYQPLLQYISKKTGLQSVLIQKRTNFEIKDLFNSKTVDIGIITASAYVLDQDQMDILAIPVINNDITFSSVIVSNKNNIRTFEDLKGKSIAFTDIASFSGYLIPLFYLKENNLDINYFSDHIFTFNSSDSIRALLDDMVDAAALNSKFFKTYIRENPEKTKNLHIVWQSPIRIGNPPIVARKNIDPVIEKKVKDALINMSNDPEGQKILKTLGYDRFSKPQPNLYLPIKIIIKKLEQ
ncbi:phosphonate transport system substrate-binding protein [Thermodesulfobium acidiphilum]|uniref:Phosphonate transport system substrate-binding protein n=1 Tax=Thermodesulfobium acidiphilum TaxID=1794699 RepID=A0A2R4W228_THEAF|nr:phosphonate transport system substrate-binding protein [Thermodesulfobium acidiphilum]